MYIPAPTNEYQKAIWEQVKADKERGPTNPIKDPDAEEEIARRHSTRLEAGRIRGSGRSPILSAESGLRQGQIRGSGRCPVLFKPVPSHREWRQGHSFQGSCGGMRRDHPSLIAEIRSISAFYVRQVHASLLPMDRISAANHMAAS